MGDVLASTKFTVRGCVFQLELTPNGWGLCVPNGKCELWLAVSSLPSTVHRVAVEFTVKCAAIGFEAKSVSHLFDRTKGIYSIGTNKMMDLDAFASLTQWHFVCTVKLLLIYDGALQCIQTAERSLGVFPVQTLPNSSSDMLSIAWPFTEKAVAVFNGCTTGDVMTSDKFTVKGCVFQLELTPNGWGRCVPSGQCEVWLAVSSLPSTVKRVLVDFAVKCSAIGFESKTVSNLFEPGKGIYSFGTSKMVDYNAFDGVAQWQFECTVKIIEMEESLEALVSDLRSKLNVSETERVQLQQQKALALQEVNDLKVQYPSWWNLQQLDDAKYDDAVLIDLPLQSAVAVEVIASFKATAANNVLKVEGVMNRLLYDRWWNEKRALTKSVGANKVNERCMFHGTRCEETMQIVVREGFRKVFNKAAASGYGTYLAKNASYSVGYSSNKNGVRKMFRCNVLCGESHSGNGSYTLTTWPKKANGLIYDSLVAGNINDPTVVVIHENARIYPMFIIHFK